MLKSQQITGKINRKIYFARGSTRKLIAIGYCDGKFTVKHKGVDAKLICLVKHAIKHKENSEDAPFIVKLTLGDIDISVILLKCSNKPQCFH